MPRIVSALAIAAAIIIGVFIIKNKSSEATNPTELVAEQIQNANQGPIATYQQELSAEGVASDTAIIIPPPTSDVTATTTDIPPAPLTATDKLAQSILQTYVNTKDSGVDISSDVASQIADNLLSQSYTDSSSAKIYSVNNITVEPTDSKQSIINYGNAVGKAFAIPLPKDGQYELAIFSNFATTNNAALLSQLTENITRYQKIVSGLLAIPVPENFVQVHLAVINALSAMIYEIEGMQNFPTDPIGGQNAAQAYQNTFLSLTAALNQEKSLFISSDVTFTTGEPGDFLTQ
jgi:hypothetical protein